MPTYDYKCDACEHTWEEFQSIKAEPTKKCPSCGKKKAKRLIGAGAGLIFRGSGFYLTDYRSDSYKKSAEADKQSQSGGDSSKSSSDSKTSSNTSAPAAKSSDSSSKKSDSAPLMVLPMTCPICGKPVVAGSDPVASLAPFCSQRCRQIDFFRWNDGRYAIVESLDPARLPGANPEDIDPELLPDE